jgi:hypothetical protein
MNYVESFDQPHVPVTARAAEVSPIHRQDKRRRWGGRLLGLGVLLVLVTALGLAQGATIRSSKRPWPRRSSVAILCLLCA